MKRLMLLLSTLAVAASLWAQAPQGFTYQAAVRNADGTAVANRQVSVRLALLQGGADGAERYAEMHRPTTDAAGLFSIVVGQGHALVNCLMEQCVDWADGPWFLLTQVDPANGSDYTLTTVQQLMSVPYALYAARTAGRDSVVVHIRDSVVVHIRDSVVVHIRDSIIVHDSTVIVYDTVQPSDTTGWNQGVEGLLPGRFSINGLEQVAFASGNLQYRATDSVWRFALHQYDVMGGLNGNVAPTYNGWIDLFGYGTSGHSGLMPYETSDANGDYPSQNINGTPNDWGVHNAIDGGGDSAGLWRTLRKDEWEYLLGSRANASQLRSLGKVAGVQGLILLPDEWQLPAGVSFTPNMNNTNTNDYTAAQWATMEAAGAVFLPAAGVRYGTEVSSQGTCGYYATSTHYGSSTGNLRYIVYYCYTSYSSYDWDHTGGAAAGTAVRLVHDIPRF